MENVMLKKWWEVYANDDEKKFFVGKDGSSGLVRKAKYEWRSTDLLSQESGLTKTKIESIIEKYHKVGIVVQHPKDPEKWGYWEKVAPQLANQSVKSTSDKDKEDRIDKAKKKI
jgi:hypothetical protein